MRDDLGLKYILNTPSGKPDDAELPLVIIMHGRGADARDLADIAPYIDNDAGCRFVFPNAPRPFEMYPGMTFGWSWFDGWPPTPESIAASRVVLLQFLDDVTARYPTPRGKLIVGGFSQGAMMSFDCGFRTQQPVAGIIAMSGAIFETEMPPFRPLPVLVIHGSQDDMIPVLAARRARRVLEEHGIEPEYHEFPMGHNVTPESLAVVREFIQSALLRSE